MRTIGQVLVGVLAVAMVQAEVVDGVAVKVNEDIITISEVEEALAAYRQTERREEITRELIVRRMVEKMLVIQEAKLQISNIL